MDSIKNRVTVIPHPLTDEKTKRLAVSAGLSIKQILKRSEADDRGMHVYVDGLSCADHDYIPRAGQSVVICQSLAGGGDGGSNKSVLRIVATVAIMVAAFYIAPLAGAAGTWQYAAAFAAVNMVGQLALGALIPPPTLGQRMMNAGDYDTRQNHIFNGQSNSANLWSPVYKVYGTMKVFPALASRPIIESVGLDNYFSAVYDFGVGSVKVENLKVGDTDLSQYTSEYKTHQDSFCDALQYTGENTDYQNVAVALDYNNYQEIQIPAGALDCYITIHYPKGLYRDYQYTGEVSYLIEISKNGGAWTAATSSDILISGIASNPVTYSPAHPGEWVVFGKYLYPVSISVQLLGMSLSDAYAVRFKKVYTLYPSYPSGYLRLNLFPLGGDYISLVRSVLTGSPLSLQEKHTATELRIKGSDQISGVVRNLSATATSVVRTHDRTSWQAAIESRNPAWICLDVLTGTANIEPLKDDQIDFNAWVDLAELCDQQITTTITGEAPVTTNRYTCDMLVNFETTVMELVNSILSQCRSTLKINNKGQYSVLIDEEQHTSKQLITPANSWGFKGSKTFIKPPHAIRVAFVNRDTEYEQDVCLVYADGYNEHTATEIEDITTVGITEYQAAWRFGRYMLAQGIQRQESFTVSMDLEYLAAGRGDRVSVQHDVMIHGGASGRVVSVAGAELTIDFNADLSQLTSAAITIRKDDGTIATINNVTNQAGQTPPLNIIVLPAADSTIKAGDLVAVGELNKVVNDYLIQKIEPSEDLTAKITLVKYDPAVYTADTGEIPPFNPGIGNDLSTKKLAVTDLTAQVSYGHEERQPMAYIDLNYKLMGNIQHLSHFEFFIKSPGLKAEKLGEADGLSNRLKINTFQKPGHTGSVEIQVIPVDRRKNYGGLASAQVTVDQDATPPKAPEYFSVNIQSGTADLFWFKSESEETAYYELRYTPDVTATAADFATGQSIGRADYLATRMSVGARLGTYFIRAVDLTGNASPVVYARSAVADMPGIDIIKTLDDCLTGLTGSHSAGVATIGNVLKVEEGENFYNFSALFDQGEVYEVRIVDLSNSHLIDKPTGASINSTDYDLKLEYRAADHLAVMHDWVPSISIVKPSLSAFVTKWTEWRRFDVADVTGRYFEFRAFFSLKVESYTTQIQVTSLAVEIDVTEHAIALKDYPVASGGVVIDYSPAFKEPPTVTGTIDDAKDGDYLKITQKTRSSCHAEVLNAGASKHATVNFIIVGYGKQRPSSI